MAQSQFPIIGQDFQDVFGGRILETTPGGNWVTTESLRVWVESHEGWPSGSGWRSN